jgi:hypothetical protein
MSKSGSSGEMRPLPTIHALVMLALAAGWIWYCWSHSAMRAIPHHRGRGADFLGLDRVLDMMTASLGDVALGLGTLFVFAIGTGIYVRRAQLWIDARASGEAVAYGSADLKDRALAANVDKSKRS